MAAPCKSIKNAPYAGVRRTIGGRSSSAASGASGAAARAAQAQDLLRMRSAVGADLCCNAAADTDSAHGVGEMPVVAQILNDVEEADMDLWLARKKVEFTRGWLSAELASAHNEWERIDAQLDARADERLMAYRRSLNKCLRKSSNYLEFGGNDEIERGAFAGYCCQRCCDRSAPRAMPHGRICQHISCTTLEEVPEDER